MPSRKISSTVDETLMQRALQMSGETQAETIRRALTHFVALKPETASAPPPAFSGTPSATAVATAAPQTSPRSALTRARRGLNAAIRLLRAKASNPFPPPGVDAVEETKRINIEIADLEKKVFDISQKIGALDANRLSMAPPDAATVQTISQLTDSVGRMTAAATEADQIIAVAKQIASSVSSFAG